MISAQGLAGQLPLGWSPVAAIDVAPAAITLGQPAAVSLPNIAAISANTDVLVATYDGGRHGWTMLGSSRVSADGGSIPLTITTTGQFVCGIADDAPFAPPAAVAGDLLAGVSAQQLALDVTMSGDVIPRSAPPGIRRAGRTRPSAACDAASERHSRPGTRLRAIRSHGSIRGAAGAVRRRRCPVPRAAVRQGLAFSARACRSPRRAATPFSNCCTV